MVLIRVDPAYGVPSPPKWMIAGFRDFGPCSMILLDRMAFPPFGGSTLWLALPEEPSNMRLF